MANDKHPLLDGWLFEQTFKDGTDRDYGEILFHENVEWTGGDRKEVEDRIFKALNTTKQHTSEFPLSFGKALLRSVVDKLDPRKRLVTGELLVWHEDSSRKPIIRKISLENEWGTEAYLVQSLERDFTSILDGPADRHSDLARVGRHLVNEWSGLDNDPPSILRIDASRTIALTAAWLANLNCRLSRQQYQEIFSKLSSLISLFLLDMKYPFEPGDTVKLLEKLVNYFCQSNLFASQEDSSREPAVDDASTPKD